MSHEVFTKAEWANAPRITGPGNRILHIGARFIALDFAALEMVAMMQEAAGAFRAVYPIDAAKAPVMLGDVPAALVKVETEGAEDYLLHSPKDLETLVVINGVLTVKNRRFSSYSNPNSGKTGALTSGDVLVLKPERVRLTAHSLYDTATSLALSIFGLPHDDGHELILRRIYNPNKDIDPTHITPIPHEG